MAARLRLRLLIWDPATLSHEARERFLFRWETREDRLQIVSGKDLLRRMNAELQGLGDKAVTTS